MIKRPTIRDIARLANVSHVTVSRTLRSHPSVSPETREKIQSIAKELGYRPDPMMSALMDYRRSKQLTVHQGVLAWINTWPVPAKLFETEAFAKYWAGARDRADEMGYKLEEFRLAELGHVTKLSKVLNARNIQGLLLAPQAANRSHLNLDWENFSAISLGYSLSRPRLHVVTNAQFRSVVIAMRTLRSYGYRRIGYIQGHRLDERTDHTFSAGFLREQLRAKEHEVIPLLTAPGEHGRASLNAVETWYKKYRPEVILTPEWVPSGVEWGALYWTKALKIKKECEVVILSLPEEEGHLSGMHQNDRLIGRTAVDQLVAMIHRHEKGIPQVPLHVLVEGRWVEGQSLGHRSKRPKTSKKRARLLSK